MEVKILTYTSTTDLEKEIMAWCNNRQFSLAGPVCIGLNGNGNVVYVATLVKGEADK